MTNETYWIMWHGQFMPVWLLWTWIGVWIISFLQSIFVESILWLDNFARNGMIFLRPLINALCIITMVYAIRNMTLYTKPAVSSPGFHLWALFAIPVFFITLFSTWHKQLIYSLSFRFFGMGCLWGLFYLQFFAMPT